MIPLASTLRTMLPTPERTAFLQACFCAGERARDGWRRWRAWAEQRELGAATLPVRRLLPLLLDPPGGVVHEAPADLARLVRSARIREEQRVPIHRRVCGETLAALRGLEPVVLRGTALADTVYPDPVLRHCHDLDVHVRSAREATERTGVHARGMELSFHERLFHTGYYGAAQKEMLARAVPAVIGGAPARVLAPDDALVHVIGHAFCTANRLSLRWVGDAFFLVRAGVRWDAVLATLEQNALALPAALLLGYLATELDIDVPILAAIERSAASTSGAGLEAAVVCARNGRHGGFASLMASTPGWRERVRLVRMMTVPSPRALLWAHPGRSPLLLPALYAYGPLRFLARRVFPRRWTSPSSTGS